MLVLYTVTALAASSFALAAPAAIPPTPSRRLHRRQVPFPFNPLTIGLGAAGVHDNKKNTNQLQSLQAQITATQNLLSQLQAQEATLQGTMGGGGQFMPNLVRRQIGTILGAVGIHDSKKNRKVIQDMQQQCDSMRQQTDQLLQAEGLASQLHRRQLGIILDPIAIHKAHTDQKSLASLQAELTGINADLGRVQAAQQTRMSQMGGQVNVNVVNQYSNNGGYNGDVDAASENNYGAPSSYGAPTSYGGAGALPSNQGYGAPTSYGGALPSNQGYNAPTNAYGGGALPSNQGYGAPQTAY